MLAGVAVGALTAPALRPLLRPLARRLVKGGLLAQRQLTAVAAGLREELEDVVAEARHELAAEGDEAAPGGAPPGHGAH